MIIAALDQSGGSTPGALDRYGAPYTEENMFDVIHEMRERVVTSPAFSMVDGVIMFKQSIERGLNHHAISRGKVVYAKVDEGLNEDGTMKDFDPSWILDYGVHGTKMRSVVHSVQMVIPVVKQQVEYAHRIRSMGKLPILEPEVDINNPHKHSIEVALAQYLMTQDLEDTMLKLTIPTHPGTYGVLEVPRVALSGGYELDEAVDRLAAVENMGASFSRALLQDLNYNMSDHEFDQRLWHNISLIRSAV